MKASELIEQLKNSIESNGDLEVHFEYDYGDYPHTRATPKTFSLQPAEIYYCESINGFAIADNIEDEKVEKVFLLQS